MSEEKETSSSETPADPPATTTEQEQQPTAEATTEEGDTSLLGEPKKEAEAEATAPEPLTVEDLSFEEGFEVNEELRDEFLTAINDQELSPKDRAQRLVDLQQKATKMASEASSQAWADTQKSWRDEVKADTEIGGDKLQPALDRVGRLVTEYGSDELLNVFALTGAGNNVHVIKFLNKMAAQLTEGGPVSGGPATAPADAASKLFPSMKG